MMMKACFMFLVLSASADFTAASRAKVAVTPVQKVLELLQGMVEKGKKEKHEEQVQYAAYKQFCDDATVDKTRAIQENTQKIEFLKADIQKYEADAKALAKEISEHDEDTSVWQGDMKAAKNVREIENTDYVATHRDYSESIDALGRAIVILKKQNFDRKQATELTQIMASVPSEAKKIINNFLEENGGDTEQEDSEDLAAELRSKTTAPEANAYESQSSGIVDMLNKLLDKFEEERDTLEKEETNSRHAFQMLTQDLTAQVEQSEKAREEKAGAKAKKQQAAADAKGDLQDTTTTLADDKKYLADLTATCEQKGGDFQERQQLRGEEIEAIEKAIEILSSGSVAGAAEKHLPQMLQVKVQKGNSFVQLRGDGDLNPTQFKVATYLRARADELGSKVLSALSMRVTADPFKKVKELIKGLIVKLMEEANEEAEHKGWCDTELSTNEQTRTEKTEGVEVLHAEVDLLQASISKLTEDISGLSAAVAELDTAMAEATKLRGDEKAKNTATIKDATDAQTAVAQALTVLKEFYAKAAEATALVQKQPEIFDAPYKGMQGASGGPIGLLEVIQSDFARLEAETNAAENQAQREYDQFMSDSAVDKAQKSKDIEHKTAKKQNQEQSLQEKKVDLEGTQKELDAALAYYEKLKPACVDSGVSYSDRVARRKEEIQSLQEALKILNGEDIAL